MTRYSRTLLATMSLAALCGASVMAQQKTPASSSNVVRVADFRGEVGPEMGGRPGFGHGGPDFGPPGMWWKNPDIAQKINLTDDQKKKMDDIFQQSRMQLIDLKANVEKQELLLEPMLSSNPPDTNKVLAQIDHVASARAELEKAMARMLLSIRSVLTADQWTKLQADRPKFSPRFGDHSPGGPAGGPPSNGFKSRGGMGVPMSSLNPPDLHGMSSDNAAEIDFDI